MIERLLAIDPSWNSTGWALFENGEPIETGHAKFRAARTGRMYMRDEHIGIRNRQVYEWINNLLIYANVTDSVGRFSIAIEEPVYRRGEKRSGKSQHAFPEIISIIKLVCCQRDIPIFFHNQSDRLPTMNDYIGKKEYTSMNKKFKNQFIEINGTTKGSQSLANKKLSMTLALHKWLDIVPECDDEADALWIGQTHLNQKNK